MLKTAMAFPVSVNDGNRFGEEPPGAINEDDAEGSLQHLTGRGRAASSLHH